MFTGLIQQVAVVTDCYMKKDYCELTIQAAYTGLTIGESIAVNGVCLTVAKILDEYRFIVQLSKETLDRSQFRTIKVSSKVNVERSLRMGDPVGGHWVLGHVDGIAVCKKIEVLDGCWSMKFGDIPDHLMKYMIDKGSVAINGISLTINAVIIQGISVMIIPHTWENTNLSRLLSGDIVNIEADYLAKCAIKNALMEQSIELKE